ncbi:MAG: DMT family transporter [Alkalibacterium sp.]|nr:DMT family transporter [Alkalibacterium sp.]
MKKYLGIGLVMLAGVFWGISGGIADILMERDWSPTVISFYRGAVGLVCFFVWFLTHFRQNLTKSSRFYLWSLLAGAGVAGNFTLYFLSIQASSIPVAATLMYTAPVFVLIASFVAGIEQSTWFKWGCIAAVLFGIVLLTGSYDIESLSGSFLWNSGRARGGVFHMLFLSSDSRKRLKLGGNRPLCRLPF